MKRFQNKTLEAHEAASAFAALGSEQRLALVQIMVRAGPDGLSVGALGERSGITGSTLTHHLKILSSAGLIEQSKTGRVIACRVAFETLETLSDYLLRNCCMDTQEGGSHG
ncbi:MAG: metalloregulator ArsR/SmtB family transcription factor [Pseudomonadota bacterium]